MSPPCSVGFASRMIADEGRNRNPHGPHLIGINAASDHSPVPDWLIGATSTCTGSREPGSYGSTVT